MKIFLWTSVLIFGLIIGTHNTINGQKSYCSPTFTNGCSSWHNTTINLDSIQWSLGSTSCSVSDYTNLKTTLIKGNTYSMTVTNGSWCGVGVWIDFDNDQVFSDQEVLYYAYIAQSAQTYNFNISIPSTVTNGTYRMRVIAGWGTDCYSSSSTNGYGSCGDYQYGNFDDFTVKIVSSQTGVNENTTEKISMGPSPVENYAIFYIPENKLPLNYTITDITGKVITDGVFTNKENTIDMKNMVKGLYFVNFMDNSIEKLRFLKQ